MVFIVIRRNENSASRPKKIKTINGKLIRKVIDKNEENKVSLEKMEKPSARVKKGKKASACVHTDRPNYAKNMCNYCYHKIGRTNLATECPHVDMPVYCLKKCMTCYNMGKKTRIAPEFTKK